MTRCEDVDEEYNTLRKSDERKSWPYRLYRGLQALFEGEASTNVDSCAFQRVPPRLWRAGSIGCPQEVSFKGGLAGGLENEAIQTQKGIGKSQDDLGIDLQAALTKGRLVGCRCHD